jgi:hypothetical protein
MITAMLEMFPSLTKGCARLAAKTNEIHFFNHFFVHTCVRVQTFFDLSILTIIPAFTHFVALWWQALACLLRDPHISPAACTFRRDIAHNNKSFLVVAWCDSSFFSSLCKDLQPLSLSYEDDDG